MRTDNKGRSSSPHRITYKTDFHAIKCSFDAGISLHPGTKAASVHPANLSDPLMPHTSTSSSVGSRGRVYSTRGTKIRENIFLQMDSQLLKPDGHLVQSTSSSPAQSPHDPSSQKQNSPFSGSRRSLPNSSTTPGAFASTSTRESSLQDRLSRSDEIANIDRAALAQKFSVTRRLFETRLTEGEGIGGQMCKGAAGRESKGIADEKAGEKEGIGLVTKAEREAESAGEGRHAQEDSFNKHISVFSQKLYVQAPVARSSTFGVLDGPKSPNTSPSDPDKNRHSTGSQEAKGGTESSSRGLSLNSEKTVRAELVDVKNESSESDETEEEMMPQEAQKWLKGDGQENASKDAWGLGTEPSWVQELVDDVFEEPRLERTSSRIETGAAVRTGDGGTVVLSQEQQRESSASIACDEDTKDEEEPGEDKYWQMNELWEWRSMQTAQADELDLTDARGEESAERQERGMMQEKGPDRDVESYSPETDEAGKERESEEDFQDEHTNEEATRKELGEGSDGKENACRGQEGSEVISGTENEAIQYERESQSHPKHSTPPRQDLENDSHIGNELSLLYEEIPGVPEVSDQEDEDAAEATKRKVMFSTAPIKVRKTFLRFTVNLQHLNSSVLRGLFGFSFLCEN